MPKILANLKFKKTHCGDCRLVWRAYNDWIDEYCIKHCPLFEQPIGGRIRCPACLAAEEAAKRLEEKS